MKVWDDGLLKHYQMQQQDPTKVASLAKVEAWKRDDKSKMQDQTVTGDLERLSLYLSCFPK